MKTLFTITLLGLAFWMPLQVKAQWINSFTIQPNNPTTSDTLTILAACSYPSAGCDEHTQVVSVAGNHIYASTLHCLGVMTVICNYTDTFKIDPLPSGSYTFHLEANSGFGPSPCTPGITPGANDSISFVVGPASGVGEYYGTSEVKAFPNPAGDRLQLQGIDDRFYPVTYELLSADGKKLKEGLLKKPSDTIQSNDLPSGIYLLNIRRNDHNGLHINVIKQ